MRKKEKKMLTRMFACILAAVMLIGCGKPENTDTNADSGEKKTSGKGRYLEEDYKMPKDEYALDIRELSDGTIRLVGSGGIYDSKDGGKTWDKLENTTDVFENEDYMVSSASINKEGEILLWCFRAANEDGVDYIHIAKDGTSKTLELNVPMAENSGGASFSYVGGDAVSGDVISEKQVPETSDDTEQNEGEEEPPQVMTPETDEPDATGDSTEEGEQPSVESNFEMGNAMFNIGLHEPKLTDDGMIIGRDSGMNLVLVDPESGEVTKTFEFEKDPVMAYFAVGKQLVVNTMKGFEFYDLESGELMESSEVLNNFYAQKGVSDDYSSFQNQLISSGSENNSLIFADRNGIYQYVLDGTVVEEIVNGSLTSLADPGYSLRNLVPKKDNSFLVLMMDGDGNSMLKNFTYSAEADATPSKEIKAYALYDNSIIRAAISQFQRENPDVYVNLEIGVPSNSGVEPSDAIRTLNTNIMAGTGPDILLLDQMPIDSYIEKDVLMDLTALIDEVDKEDGIFRNITDSYADGEKVYALPTRFVLPLVAAPKDSASSVKDLASLTEAVEQLREKDAEIRQIISSDSAEELLKLLFITYGSEVLKEDGTLKEEAIQNFYQLVKRIYDTDINKGQSEEMSMSAVTATELGTGISLEHTVMDEIFNIAAKMGLISIMNTPSVSDMQMLGSIVEQMDYSYQSFSGDGKESFIPRGVIGINAKTNYTEECSDFIKTMLGMDHQAGSVYEGFPVNKKAFDKASEKPDTGEGEESAAVSAAMMEDDLGNQVFLQGKWLTEEEIAQLRSKVESLNHPVLTDDIITKAVVSEGVKFLEGDTTAEDAVQEVMKKLNIYLAE